MILSGQDTCRRNEATFLVARATLEKAGYQLLTESLWKKCGIRSRGDHGADRGSDANGENKFQDLNIAAEKESAGWCDLAF